MITQQSLPQIFQTPKPYHVKLSTFLDTDRASQNATRLNDYETHRHDFTRVARHHKSWPRLYLNSCLVAVLRIILRDCTAYLPL